MDTHVTQPAGRSAKWAALDPHRHEPGFLGSIPYILILRYLIAFAVTARFSAHRSEYAASQWSIRVAIIALIWLATLIATYVALKPALRRSPWIQATTILADVVLISVAYQLTGQYGSDFFLFYYLPIFASVEYLGGWGAIAVSLGVGFAMVVTVHFMHPMQEASLAQWKPVLQVLLLRWAFLLAVAMSSAFVFRGLSHRQAQLLTLLDALHSGAAGIPDVQALEEALETILSELTEKLNFEFAAISLVDEYRNCIETVRGRNISPGWIMRAKHQLGEPDIQTHIVKTGETKVIVGWDDLLDKTICERFEHWRLARVWAPIYSAAGLVVGTIEAGCDKERKDEVLTDLAIERVKQLGREKGDEIARRRPHVLLQNMANDAIQLIGADSASLHVYRLTIPDSSAEAEREWGELILAAGAGKADPEFVQSYEPKPEGRGRKAIRTGEPVWIDDPRQFRDDYPWLYERGLRALAVIPLKLGPDTAGVLAIHSWQSGKKFTSREINLAETFAREMEGVIQNYLLLRRATEGGSRAWALSGLQSLMQSLTSPFNLRDVLAKIAKNALLTLDADNVTLYEYQADRNMFYAPPVVDGHFVDHDSMKTDLRPDDILFEFVKRGVSHFIEDVDTHGEPDLAAAGKRDKARFVKREKIRSCAVLVLRSRGEMVGLLFVNFRQLHNFSGEEKRAMDALSASAALAIRNARLHRDDLNRLLAAMHQVHAAIAEKPDLKPVLERLLQQTLDMTGATYGVCMWWNENLKLLEPIARWPARGDYPIEPQTLEEGVIGLAAKSRRSILVEDVEDQNKSVFVETVGEVWPARIYKIVNPDARCEIAVPLLDEGQLVGVLNIEHPRPRALTQDNLVFLETLGVPAIIAFHTVELYKKLERRIRHLRALNLVAERVQGNPYELDMILRLFLTGITAGDGLGFSRAMLFLTNEEGHTLRGESGIGPVTEQQAKDVWEKFEHGDSPLPSGLDYLLQQAEESSDETNGSSPLNIAIQRETLLIDYAAGAPAECLLNGKTVTIEHDQRDPFREILGSITHPNNVLQAFTAVPLIGKHIGRIGALVVDNRFLWKEGEIDAEDIAGLEAFAGLLALSIENVRLWQKVTEEQRLENWKEITADIAHTVGTRISAIKGTVTRLRSLIEVSAIGDATMEMQALLERLSLGISKAETVLLEFRTYAASGQLQTKQLDLVGILKEILEDTHESYEIIAELPTGPLLVCVDSLKLGNALIEIIKNAHEAMLGMTHRPRLIWITMNAERRTPTAQKYARIDITDNGPGIAAEVIGKLFEPFVTTKNGTGLGLAIAKGVVERHQGTIQADNHPGRGARFMIHLPMLDGSLDRN